MDLTKYKVLIVEDDPDIRGVLKMTLELAGLKVIEAKNGHECLTKLENKSPDLVIVDWMMPGMDGVELVRRIRQPKKHLKLPVIMLTAKSEEMDRVDGLDAGADDYITKPWRNSELLARIRALLRRSSPEQDGLSSLIQIGSLEINQESHRITLGGEELLAGPMEYKIIQFFMENPGKVFSRAELLDKIWGTRGYVEERTVDVHIRRVRKLLMPFENCITTIRGAGYRFDSDRLTETDRV